MTDSSALIPNRTAVSSDVLYDMKASAVRSKSYRASLAPTNSSSFSPGQTCIMYIPCGRRNCYLNGSETYLRYTVKNNDATSTIAFDGSGASVINRIDIFHGSNLIESLQSYNLLYNYILDVQMNPSTRIGLSSMYGFLGNNNQINEAVFTASLPSTSTGVLTVSGITSGAISPGSLLYNASANLNETIYIISQLTGTGGGTGTYLTNYLTATAVASSTFTSILVNPSAGLLNSRQGAIIPNTTTTTVGNSFTVCMPLMSGSVGLLLDKYLATNLLIDDIRLEISFENTVQGMVYSSYTAGTTAAWTISNIELEAQFLELSDEGQHMVNSVSNPNEDLYLHGSSFRHFTSSLAASTSGLFSTLVPARFCSLKQLVCLPRRSTEINSATSYSLGSRINPGISTFWYRVGSALIPQKYITLENSNSTQGYSEGFAELLRTQHALGSYYVSSSLPANYYNVNDIAISNGGCINSPQTGALSYQNGFALALNTQSFSNRDSVVLCGMNTLSSQVFFECQINTAPSSGAAYTLNFLAEFDHILVISGGIMSVRF